MGHPYDMDPRETRANLIRWNALAMVVRANRERPELGGHIATYASAADLFEVGFNHFFRAGPGAGTEGSGPAATGRGDLVYFQPHSAPGVYARAFLEGRLSEQQLAHYRQGTGGNGLPSYPHPWLMPGFWQFPNASMGLGPIGAIYQARFLRYLEHRGLAGAAGGKVWAFIGDGEMDEPESLAGLSLAAREGLDNLIFVVKLIWGSDWDALFARDRDGVLLKRLHETVDGEFQTYAATDGRFNREHFFNKYPELQALVAHLSDDEALLAFRDRFALPLSDDDVTNLRFYRPAAAARPVSRRRRFPLSPEPWKARAAASSPPPWRS